MKLYKVLNKDLQAKDGGTFDYTEYVNSGKSVPRIDDISLCNKGYHVTEYWNMWIDKETNRIFEIEAEDLEEGDSVGVIEKHVCKSFKFVKEVIVKYDNNSNTGNRNTGNSNTGNSNTGNSNTGNSNTGDWNTGDWNTGDWNTGDSNTGDRNTGNWNTGYSNTGDWNTGDSNTGDWNTGNRNTGDSNTGDWNTGNRNTGNWNNCNYETGFFNTIQSETVRIFNKDCDRKLWEESKKPNFIYFNLEAGKTYKECFQKSFEFASKEDVELLLNLPNFDYKAFEEISGITKKMIQKKLK